MAFNTDKPTTVGFSIENSTNHEHITAFYPRELSMETFGMISQDIALIVKEIENPVYVSICGLDNFGPNKDIPVYRVKFQEKSYEKMFVDLWWRYDDSDERRNGLHDPEWHITIKKGGSVNFYKDSPVQPLIRLDSIFMKHLGPHDPYAKFDLP